MITGVLSNSTNSEIERSEPENFNLHQNFPNPFNPSTTINFDVNRASDVIISVFDLNGRIILELVNAFYNSGSYSVDFDATNLASGTYIYEMRSPDYVKIKTFTLIK
ncbi:MAG: T9SS type A sorting domain-containing protein, partial [Balneolaceae bacterium]